MFLEGNVNDSKKKASILNYDINCNAPSSPPNTLDMIGPQIHLQIPRSENMSFLSLQKELVRIQPINLKVIISVKLLQWKR